MQCPLLSQGKPTRPSRFWPVCLSHASNPVPAHFPVDIILAQPDHDHTRLNTIHTRQESQEKPSPAPVWALWRPAAAAALEAPLLVARPAGQAHTQLRAFHPDSPQHTHLIAAINTITQGCPYLGHTSSIFSRSFINSFMILIQYDVSHLHGGLCGQALKHSL